MAYHTDQTRVAEIVASQPAPASPDCQPVTAWTTYSELSADQRRRFGGYVLAKDEARQAYEHRRETEARADAALKATGGDKQAALALMLAGRV
jgi:hypothetical protein